MVTNLSASGAQLTVPAGEPGGQADPADANAIGSTGELVIEGGVTIPPLRAVVRSSAPDEGGQPAVSLGVQFLPGQEQRRAPLALALFAAAPSPRSER